MRTLLFNEHLKAGGRIVDFAGWELPVVYTSIVDEHISVRKHVGLFDVSHLGRLLLKGELQTQLDAIQYLSTNDFSDLAVGSIRYGLICNNEGGVEDDILIYRKEDSYLIIVNASNKDKIIQIIENIPFPIKIEDQTNQTAMIAIQGPDADRLIQDVLSLDVTSIKKYTFIEYDGLIISRTGYTGENGFEIIVPENRAIEFWSSLVASDIHPQLCGLGARDTLRLEAGNPLYGHEMNSNTNPFTAGFGFAIKLDKTDFIGKDALSKMKSEKLKEKLVGLTLTGTGIPRDGYEVYSENQLIGKVTSGSYIPGLNKSVALAYINSKYSAIGTQVNIQIRNRACPAVVGLKKWR